MMSLNARSEEHLKPEGIQSASCVQALRFTFVATLARISHRFKRIGAPNQRKLFCENDFVMIRGEPRCRQSVSRIFLDLKPSKGARWSRRLTVARSRRTRARCCWVQRTGRSGWWIGWHRALSIGDPRPAHVEHSVATLVGQRIFAIALGYEDLNDHETLRHDPLMAVLAGKLEARRADCAAVAGKSTLNRLELSKPEPSRYHKISYDAEAVDRLFVDLFLEAHRTAPRQITLDLDATDDPLHGEQEGRFFHGYYKSYCYLPLYIFCGRHLLCAKLRRANIDASAGSVEEVARIVAQIRRRWPKVRILLRADSGFTRDDLMTWCEQNDVDYLFALAKNDRLTAEIAAELAEAAEENRQSGKPARRFKDFRYRTRKSWSRQRRVVGKAEWMIPSVAES